MTLVMTIDSAEAPVRRAMMERIAKRLDMDTEIKAAATDLSIGTLLGIELKLPSDFINSIKDKRVFKQAQDLADNYERRMIMIEGTYSDVLGTRRGMQISALNGAVYSLALKYGVPVQFTHPAKAGMLEMHLDAAIRKGISKHERTSFVPRVKKTTHDQAIALIAAFPGIGATNAEAILKHYHNPRTALRNVDFWAEVPGIGKKTVDRCKDLLRYSLLHPNQESLP